MDGKCATDTKTVGDLKKDLAESMDDRHPEDLHNKSNEVVDIPKEVHVTAKGKETVETEDGGKTCGRAHRGRHSGTAKSREGG
mmetsp:Transcript_32354/g.106807  ORF Transcript_32354/g.106807 Transcript_32354/m.106807 type:complete len:83 (-) Transcript_32354:659-907(-)